MVRISGYTLYNNCFKQEFINRRVSGLISKEIHMGVFWSELVSISYYFYSSNLRMIIFLCRDENLWHLYSKWNFVCGVFMLNLSMSWHLAEMFITSCFPSMVFSELRQQQQNSILFICFFFVEKRYGKTFKVMEILLLQTLVPEKKLPHNSNFWVNKYAVLRQECALLFRTLISINYITQCFFLLFRSFEESFAVEFFYGF